MSIEFTCSVVEKCCFSGECLWKKPIDMLEDYSTSVKYNLKFKCMHITHTDGYTWNSKGDL